jgi:hypothetical protein
LLSKAAAPEAVKLVPASRKRIIELVIVEEIFIVSDTVVGIAAIDKCEHKILPQKQQKT